MLYYRYLSELLVDLPLQGKEYLVDLESEVRPTTRERVRPTIRASWSCTVTALHDTDHPSLCAAGAFKTFTSSSLASSPAADLRGQTRVLGRQGAHVEPLHSSWVAGKPGNGSGSELSKFHVLQGPLRLSSAKLSDSPALQSRLDRR